MEEETVRKMAVKQYLQGKAPISIYREIGRSKKWFFKWLRRNQSGDPDWYRDQSRTPRSHPHQTHPDTHKLIVSIRTQLEANPYAQVGTSAIKWEFKKLGLSPPSDPTINRILKREGLVKKNPYTPKGVEYPYFTEPLGVNNIHQADLLGPRYIKGNGRFYSLNVMDLYSHRVFLHPPTKETRSNRSFKPDQLLEDHGIAGLSSSRQPTVFSREQSVPPLLWHCPQALSAAGDRGGLHPNRGAVAQWSGGAL